MKTLKLNFTVPEDVAESLRNRISKRKWSAFVTEAVRTKLKELEEEQLNRVLAEGYQARREEGIEIDREWQATTLERW
jgi:hypothetical protein